MGIGIHTANALRGYEVGQLARARGGYVVFGGIHATLYPEEAHELGGAHAVVKGDGDVAWARVVADCAKGTPQRFYEAGRVEAAALRPARWDLMPREHYMFASVQTVRGCPKHCSFCSVWRTDGQQPRQRAVDVVIEENRRAASSRVPLHRPSRRQLLPGDPRGFLDGGPRKDPHRLQELEAIRTERFELMARLAQLPADMIFYTQITMEAAEDQAFLDAMRKARIRGALVGIEAVTPEGLKDVYKDFNVAGDELVARLQRFRQNGVQVLGSFIFGLPSDRPDTFEATAALAQRADVAFAQFVLLTPLPGTVDFDRWENDLARDMPHVGGVPLTRYWLIPPGDRPKVYAPHPVMSADEIRRRTQGVWDPVLQPARDLAAFSLCEDDTGASGVCPDLETVSADVRQYRDCDG